MVSVTVGKLARKYQASRLTRDWTIGGGACERGYQGMLRSREIQLRQSAIRERMAELQNVQDLTEEQRGEVASLGTEYRDNEARYRAALIAEEETRSRAAEDLGKAETREWSDLVRAYEFRQVALLLDEGRGLEGATAEVVQEMRERGGYRGVPVPLAALERREDTVAAGVAQSVDTRPIIDRLFPSSMMAAMGGQLVNIGTGAVEYPVSTSEVTAGWSSTETGDVAEGEAYTTTPRLLEPDHNLGVQMTVTRRALKQLDGLEAAIRRDLTGAIQTELDRAAFLGSGASGEPSGVVSGAAGYGVSEVAVGAAATYRDFRQEVAAFITANAATGPGDVRALIRPEVWTALDDTAFDAGSGITEFDKLAARLGAVHMSGNALAPPETDTVSALLTTTAGGLPPFYVGIWGGVDLIRDPYTKAGSGSLVLTGILTADVTVTRAEQLRVLTAIDVS